MSTDERLQAHHPSRQPQQQLVLRGALHPHSLLGWVHDGREKECLLGPKWRTKIRMSNETSRSFHLSIWEIKNINNRTSPTIHVTRFVDRVINIHEFISKEFSIKEICGRYHGRESGRFSVVVLIPFRCHHDDCESAGGGLDERVG